jgi:tryptophanyl-tRNA synthetase
MSLRDGAKKMSKSDPSDYSRINMTDDADAVALKIRKAKTDPHPLPGPDALDDKGRVLAAREAERPEAFNLLGIYAALADKPLKDVLTEFEGKEFSFFKQVLSDLSVATIGKIGHEMKRLMSDRTEIDGILRNGAERARAASEPILRQVEDIVGFLRP